MGGRSPKIWCRCRQCRRHCSDSSLETLILPPKDEDDYGDLQQLKTSVIIYGVLLPGFISQLEMTRRLRIIMIQAEPKGYFRMIKVIEDFLGETSGQKKYRLKVCRIQIFINFAVKYDF